MSLHDMLFLSPLFFHPCVEPAGHPGEFSRHGVIGIACSLDSYPVSGSILSSSSGEIDNYR